MKVKLIGIIVITVIVVLGMGAYASLTIVSVDWDSVTGPDKTRQYIGISTQQVTVYAFFASLNRYDTCADSNNAKPTNTTTTFRFYIQPCAEPALACRYMETYYYLLF